MLELGSPEDQTPLHLAAFNDRVDVVEYLIGLGANLVGCTYYFKHLRNFRYTVKGYFLKFRTPPQ